MAKDFFKVALDSGEVVAINRAYIVQAEFNDSKELIVHLDKSVAHTSTLTVSPGQAVPLWSWLMEDRK